MSNTQEFQIGKWYAEDRVRSFFASLNTGETTDDLDVLVPEGDYLLTELALNDLDAWAAEPHKAENYSTLTSDFPAIIVGEDGHIYDGNHRVVAAIKRGDSFIQAFCQSGFCG